MRAGRDLSRGNLRDQARLWENIGEIMKVAHLFRFVLITFVALLWQLPAICYAQQPAAALSGFTRSELTVETEPGAVHQLRVYLALTPKQRAQGLMFVARLAPDEGMLFDFGPPQRVSMWMKNTLIPLDMLFIDGDGIIVNIAVRTVPGSLAAVNSAGKVRAVLELNGGTARRLGLQPGDRVRHSIFSR